MNILPGLIIVQSSPSVLPQKKFPFISISTFLSFFLCMYLCVCEIHTLRMCDCSCIVLSVVKFLISWACGKQEHLSPSVSVCGYACCFNWFNACYFPFYSFIFFIQFANYLRVMHLKNLVGMKFQHWRKELNSYTGMRYLRCLRHLIFTGCYF